MAASRRARAQGWVVGPRGQPVFAATGREHGTRSMYATGCRCTPCRTANGKYRRARPKVVPTPDPALDAILAECDAALAQLIADGDAVDITLLSDDDRAMLEAFDELPIEGMFLALSKALRDAEP